jgi:hypothetical protein
MMLLVVRAVLGAPSMGLMYWAFVFTSFGTQIITDVVVWQMTARNWRPQWQECWYEKYPADSPKCVYGTFGVPIRLPRFAIAAIVFPVTWINFAMLMGMTGGGKLFFDRDVSYDCVLYVAVEVLQSLSLKAAMLTPWTDGRSMKQKQQYANHGMICSRR